MIRHFRATLRRSLLPVTEIAEPQKQKLPAVFDASLPVLIEEEGPGVQERSLEFFAAQIRNPNTRKA